MYLVVIAWMYVVLMMSVAEATHPGGTVLGAIVTFFLYGIVPLAVVIYLLRTPARRRALRAREAAQDAQRRALPEATVEPGSAQPDAGGHAPGAAQPGGVAPVREEA